MLKAATSVSSIHQCRVSQLKCRIHWCVAKIIEDKKYRQIVSWSSPIRKISPIIIHEHTHLNVYMIIYSLHSTLKRTIPHSVVFRCEKYYCGQVNKMNEERLINLVQSYNELYDVKNPEYHYQYRKENFREEIGMEMKNHVRSYSRISYFVINSSFKFVIF